MTDSTNIERISQPEIMTGYLHRLKQARTLLSVSIPEVEKPYNSIIIGVDIKKNQILLDVLHPESAHAEIMKHKKFSVTAEHEGIKLGFKGNIKELKNDDGKLAYLIDYPAALIYYQQRSSYRAHASVGDRIEVTINDENDKNIQGIITDLSLGGVGLQFETKTTLPFKEGMLLPFCQFDTPNKTDFECALEVRNIRQDANSRFIYIGTRFVELDKREERQIERFVVQLERGMIKRSQR